MFIIIQLVIQVVIIKITGQLQIKIALDTYDNYQVQLNNVKKNWTRYSGEINLISENDNNIVIFSLKVTDSLFYNEIYTVKIQASIKDNYKPENAGNKLASQISLLIDDKEVT